VYPNVSSRRADEELRARGAADRKNLTAFNTMNEKREGRVRR